LGVCNLLGVPVCLGIPMHLGVCICEGICACLGVPICLGVPDTKAIWVSGAFTLGTFTFRAAIILHTFLLTFTFAVTGRVRITEKGTLTPNARAGIRSSRAPVSGIRSSSRTGTPAESRWGSLLTEAISRAPALKNPFWNSWKRLAPPPPPIFSSGRVAAPVSQTQFGRPPV
jgi:hypothetical protein